MALMQWSDQLALGVERMDETHREFVARLNALHVAPEEDFIPLLDAFIEHTVEHFAQEQRWMGELDFAPIHCHTREHESVLDIMHEVRRLVSEGKPEVGRVLTRELAPWFESHAAGMDAMLAFFLLRGCGDRPDAGACGAIARRVQRRCGINLHARRRSRRADRQSKQN